MTRGILNFSLGSEDSDEGGTLGSSLRDLPRHQRVN